MKKHNMILVVACLLSTTANAALESRLGGLAVYDTDFNITWLANANTNGLMNWFQADAWAAGLTVAGVGGWRLPTTLQPDASCFYPQAAGTFNCTGSEMGHLFYNELGGSTGVLITMMHNSNYNLFQNIQSYYYWSGTDYQQNDYAWEFRFNGYQDAYSKVDHLFYTMAVHDGDVASVPLPAAISLFWPSLLGLGVIARRKCKLA